MIGSIGSFLVSAGETLNSIDLPSLKTVGEVAVGIVLVYLAVMKVLPPIASKIHEVAMRSFYGTREWFNDKAVFMRLRSMGCQECASNHRNHVYPVNVPLKTFNEGNEDEQE